MTPPRKNRTKALATANKAVSRLHPALENLVERLSSPRLRAPGTISSYLVTGANFLSTLKDNQAPTDSDFRRYFIRRRQGGVSERTLRKEFFHLKKLAIANNWPWPFESDDAPYPEEENKLPVLLQAEVEHLIKAKAKLSRAERFYLAVATTWLVCREELSRIKKRDYDGETFVIHTVKHGRKVKHLIPDALKPIFADYRPKQLSPAALSTMFQRICAKAGLEHRKGYGWHSIRYRLNTLLKDVCLPQNRDTDPYGTDRVIYSIHPFLPLWERKPSSKRVHS